MMQTKVGDNVLMALRTVVTLRHRLLIQ